MYSGRLLETAEKTGCSHSNSLRHSEAEGLTEEVNAGHSHGSALPLDQSLCPLRPPSFSLLALLVSILGQANPFLWPSTVLDCH